MKVCFIAASIKVFEFKLFNLFTRGRSAAIILLYNLRCRLWLLSIVPLALNAAACTISYKEHFLAKLIWPIFIILFYMF